MSRFLEDIPHRDAIKKMYEMTYDEIITFAKDLRDEIYNNRSFDRSDLIDLLTNAKAVIRLKERMGKR